MSAAQGFVGMKHRALARATPVTVYLELTYRCQWRCVFCYNPPHDHERTMSLSEWSLVLDDLRELGTLFVVLTGGDPMTHPDFWPIAEAVRERAFALRVLTNGSRVGEPEAARFSELRAMSVEMSLHGATPAVHDATTGRPGSFAGLWTAVDCLRRQRVPVVLKTVLTSLNAAELKAIVALAAERDVPLRVDPTVTPRDDGERAPLRFAPPPSAVAELMERLRGEGRIPTVGARQPEVANCGLGRLTMAVDPEGRVFPCMQWREDSLGNVRDFRLRELWRRSMLREDVARVAVAANERLRRMGGPLAAYPFCPGVAQQLTGDPTAPDPAFVTNALAAGRVREN